MSIPALRTVTLSLLDLPGQDWSYFVLYSLQAVDNGYCSP